MTFTNHPVVLFGIDGATYSILDPLIAEGKLPNLQRLKQEGAWGGLQSTIHPLTPAAWVSMVTGLNPGKHGVYDFRRRKTATYDWELVNSRSWSGDPIWSILGKQNREVGVFNVPMTYPPRPVNGFMVSGLGTPPNSQNFIYPAELALKFKEQFPGYLLEPSASTENLNEYLSQNEQLLDEHIEALRYVWHKYPNLNFFMPVFIETDRIHHVYWRFIDPAMPDYNEPVAVNIREHVAAIYQKIDAIIGELWAWAADRQGYILVVSDHGFGPLLKDVYINKWLINQGYLTLKTEAPAPNIHFFDQVDWSKTQAYSFGYFGNINLNLHGREPRGIVEFGREAEMLKDEIATHLLNFADPDTGEMIVDRVYRKEELYSGIYLDQASDLLVVMKDYAYMTRDGFDVNNQRLVGPPMEHIKQTLPHSGNHRLEGIVLLAGNGIKPGFKFTDAVITDIAPTVLYLANSSIPYGLDGQILIKAFEENFVADRTPGYTLPESNGAENKSFQTLLLEKDIRISLLDDELRKLQRIIAEKDNHIQNQADLIQRFKNGRIMRLLAWLTRFLNPVSAILVTLALIVTGCAQENIIPPTDTVQPIEVTSPISPISPPATPVSSVPSFVPEPSSSLPAKLTGPLTEYTINNGLRADFVPLPFYNFIIWTGITWDGNDYIWIANNELKVITGFNIQKASSDRIVSYPLDLKHTPTITGLTWDGSNFWVSDIANEMIYQIDLNTGKKLQGFSYDGTPNGLIWDKDNFWVVSKERLAIEKISLTGEQLLSLPIQGIWPSGLTWDGKYFWYSDANEGTISLLNPITGKSKKLDEIKFLANPGTFNGMTWMNGYLWIVTEADERLHRFDVSQLDLKEIDASLQ